MKYTELHKIFLKIIKRLNYVLSKDDIVKYKKYIHVIEVLLDNINISIDDLIELNKKSFSDKRKVQINHIRTLSKEVKKLHKYIHKLIKTKENNNKKKLYKKEMKGGLNINSENSILKKVLSSDIKNGTFTFPTFFLVVLLK